MLRGDFDDGMENLLRECPFSLSVAGSEGFSRIHHAPPTREGLHAPGAEVLFRSDRSDVWNEGLGRSQWTRPRSHGLRLNLPDVEIDPQICQRRVSGGSLIDPLCQGQIRSAPGYHPRSAGTDCDPL